jgi:hypothetical protein
LIINNTNYAFLGHGWIGSCLGLEKIPVWLKKNLQSTHTY